MQLLKQIHVAGWKSIKAQTIEFGPLNVMIGANGSGKSNLLAFFRLLLAVSQNDLARLIARAGRSPLRANRSPENTDTVRLFKD